MSLLTLRRLALGAAFIAVLGVIPLPASGAVVQTRPKTTVDEVSQELTCQCGCGLTLANCNHPNCKFAVPARQQIAEMIDRGMGKTEIVAFFRNRYGEKVLSAPTTEGFNLLAWTMPFVALVLGGGFVVLMFARWRDATPSLPAGPETVAERVPVIDPKLRELLEARIREQL